MEPALSVYIDEAGDPGVHDGIRHFEGRHEWLVISAVVTQTTRDPETVDWVRELRAEGNVRQKPDLHYAQITAARRLAVCQALARKPVRAFSVISHKTNMRTYENDTLGRMTDPKRFYNWCMRFLFERVMEWCGEWQKVKLGKHEPLRVIFSENKGHGYPHMFAYFDKLTMQHSATGMHLRPRCWLPALADRGAWCVEPSTSRAGLQLADVVASAFYQAANTVSSVWDIEPAKSLRPILPADAKKRRANFSVTVLPLESQAPVPEAARPIFEHYGYKFG